MRMPDAERSGQLQKTAKFRLQLDAYILESIAIIKNVRMLATENPIPKKNSRSGDLFIFVVGSLPCFARL
eukprot:scaffold38223_cov17-Prasinocladus_malaysianus.AAC.1